jgi:hypothetical protein
MKVCGSLELVTKWQWLDDDEECRSAMKEEKKIKTCKKYK